MESDNGGIREFVHGCRIHMMPWLNAQVLDHGIIADAGTSSQGCLTGPSKVRGVEK